MSHFDYDDDYTDDVIHGKPEDIVKRGQKITQIHFQEKKNIFFYSGLQPKRKKIRKNLFSSSSSSSSSFHNGNVFKYEKKNKINNRHYSDVQW